MRDITLRALDTLAACSVVLCEDTRVTSRLLFHHGISGLSEAAANARGTVSLPTAAAALLSGSSPDAAAEAGPGSLGDEGRGVEWLPQGSIGAPNRRHRRLVSLYEHNEADRLAGVIKVA
jgi:hypothetical protein